MRDWSSLRDREWKPTALSEAAAKNAADAAATGESKEVSASSAGEKSVVAGPALGASGSQSNKSVFRIDNQISGARPRGERELQKWVPAADDALPLEALESIGNGHSNSNSNNHKPKRETWDQFRANEELFGVVSTFKTDLSQYTTPLDVKRVPKELRHKADKIAAEIDGKLKWDDGIIDGEEAPDAEDEEALFSSVPRSSSSRNNGKGGTGQKGYAGAAEGYAGGGGGGFFGGGDAGGNLLAKLKAGSGAVQQETGYRGTIAPTVQEWWRSRAAAGASIPPGAEDGLVCPFSQRTFGEVSQLVMHWAAVLPRGENTSFSECPEATEQFKRVGRELRWSALAERAGLEKKLSVETPEMGSVWEQVLTKVKKKGSTETPIAERLAGDFVTEAVLIRPWKREQKVEHREVLEGMAAGLALYSLDTSSSCYWNPVL